MKTGHVSKSFSVFSIPVNIIWMAYLRPASAGRAIRGPSGVEWSLLTGFWNFLIFFLILKDLLVASARSPDDKAFFELVFGLVFATEIAFIPYFFLCLIAIAMPSFLFFRDKNDRLAAVSSLIVAVSVVGAPVALYVLISGSHLDMLKAHPPEDMSLLAHWAQHATYFDIWYILQIFVSAWVYTRVTDNSLAGTSRRAKALYFFTACALAKLIEFPAIIASVWVLGAVAALSQYSLS